MKTIYSMAMLVACCVIMAGCNGAKKDDDNKKDDKSGDTKTSMVTLEQDTCAMCGTGGCAGECPADGEKCECGFHKGSDLCCVEGLKPTEGVYCKGCGHLKGTEDCCKEGAKKCDCGNAEGSPMCCKIEDKDGHDHDGEDHDHDHEGDDHDHDKK